jgi:hypothetical protein
VNTGYQGAQQSPSAVLEAKARCRQVPDRRKVVAKLIPLEIEDKPPKRRAAPASTVIEGRTGRAAFSAGLVVLSPRSGLTS